MSLFPSWRFMPAVWSDLVLAYSRVSGVISGPMVGIFLSGYPGTAMLPPWERSLRRLGGYDCGYGHFGANGLEFSLCLARLA